MVDIHPPANNRSMAKDYKGDGLHRLKDLEENDQTRLVTWKGITCEVAKKIN